jgi:hypothetical protein
VLLSQHFPGLLARFGGAMIPVLSDPKQKKTTASNLAAPFRDGEEKSSNQPGRAVSLYAIARKPAAKVAFAALLGLSAAALAVRHQTRGEAE